MNAVLAVSLYLRAFLSKRPTGNHRDCQGNSSSGILSLCYWPELNTEQTNSEDFPINVTGELIIAAVFLLFSIDSLKHFPFVDVLCFSNSEFILICFAYPGAI